MGKYITFGNYNNQYKYIIFFVLFIIIYNSLKELNYYDMLKGIKYPFFKYKNIEFTKFDNYNYIRLVIVGYFGTFILACISIIYDKIKNKREIKKKPEKEIRNYMQLIHENNQENEERNISFFFVLVIILGWVFEEFAIELYNTNLCHLDFWFFELIIIAYLNKEILHIEIYKHHIFVFIFSSIPILFKIGSIILECSDNDDHYPYEQHWYWFPLGLIIYSILIIIKSYAIVKIKWLMELKYISENKLLIIYGIMGTAFYSIFSIISSITENENDNINNENIFINLKYSFYSYYLKFIGTETKIIEIIVEIILLIVSMITSYYIKYNFMMIIKYLTPVHIVLITPTFYFFSKLILLINTTIYYIVTGESHFFITKINYPEWKFILDICQDIFSFFGFLVYLEIIELNFCGLNYNLRDKIIKRAYNELLKNDDCISSTDESINVDSSINSDDTIENIINVSHNSNISY